LIFSRISDVSLQKEVGSMLRVGSNNADRPALRDRNASFEVAGSMNGMLPFRCSEDMTAAAKDVLARFERFF
jgi:hypothetical protein